MKTTPIIEGIMGAFAERTGLDEGATRPPVRYLWTDAFAVCNFLELFRRTGERSHLRHALALVDQVHRTLGRHRDDDARKGWISGFDEAEGIRHPTRGGLRIGKPLPERSREGPFDERTEWDRDGQYFHYLTKWMHALDRVARVSGDPTYLRWAVELAASAHAAFVYRQPTGGRRRMFWKMSIDLSYPLVPSMGHHDPLDGLLTYRQTQAAGAMMALPETDCDLAAEVADMAAMCEGVSWETSDPLGIGGLLIDACRMAQLVARADLPESERLAFLLDEAEHSLASLARMRPLDAPVEHRLAFRELGLSIGLRAVDHIGAVLKDHRGTFPNFQTIAETLSRLARFRRWIDAIEAFWLEPRHQESANWQAHLDINSVMLATSLGPDGFLIAENPDLETWKSS